MEQEIIITTPQELTTDNSIRQAVDTIKAAIVQSQARAARMVVGEQLSLYFGVGLYVSEQSKLYAWGTGALQQISEQLSREMPGLHGFSEKSIRNMRQFAEFWCPFLIGSPSAAPIHSPLASKLQNADVQEIITYDYFDLANWSPMASEINRDEFLGISFSHHMEILHKVKDIREVLHCIHLAYTHRWDKYKLRALLKEGIPQPEDAVRDYTKPMGVATYRTADEMPIAMRKVLPPTDEILKLMTDW